MEEAGEVTMGRQVFFVSRLVATRSLRTLGTRLGGEGGGGQR